MAKTTTTTTEKVKHDVRSHNERFLYNKSNYMLMGIGLLMIIVGFLLMVGGKSEDPHQFNYDEIYSFRRSTLAPILVLAGFVVEIVAIMRKPK